MADGFLVFLGLLAAYLLAVFLLVKTGLMRRWNLSLFLGVALMIKTTRGQGLLNWFARARTFFDRSASFGLWLTGFLMAAMVALLLWQLTIVFDVPPEQAPGAELILGIPGINPIIPVFYGIVALVFAVVVHEYSHGIMARVYDLRVKTMGILLFIVPIGAFVEPDEEQLKAAPRAKRIKVFSAGPLSNIVFAVLFATLFSGVVMAGAQPAPGVPVEGVEAGGPATAAGLEPGDVLTALNGSTLRCGADFSQAMQGLARYENAIGQDGQGFRLWPAQLPVSTSVGATYRVTLEEAPAAEVRLLADASSDTVSLSSADSTVDGEGRLVLVFTPADWQAERTVHVNASSPGESVVTHVSESSDPEFHGLGRFEVRLRHVERDFEVPAAPYVYPAISVQVSGDAAPTTITPVSRVTLARSAAEVDAYAEYPELAAFPVVGIRFFPTCNVVDWLTNPLGSVGNFLRYISLPFLALEGQFPLAEPYNQYIEAPFHAPTFWVLANLAYWLFWINLMLGLTNALPIVPLDGGHMFRDFVEAGLARLRPSMEEAARKRMAARISGFTALFLVLVIAMQFMGPGIAAWFRG